MEKLTQGGFLMTKIHQISGRVFGRMLKEHDIEINPAQGRILFVLWRQDEIPIHELAKQTSLGKSTLTSMVDRLEAAGLVRRVPSKDDRRKILIQRTEKDRSLEALYMQISREMRGIYYQGFSDEDIHRFEHYLTKIFDNLSQAEKRRQLS